MVAVFTEDDAISAENIGDELGARIRYVCAAHLRRFYD